MASSSSFWSERQAFDAPSISSIARKSSRIIDIGKVSSSFALHVKSTPKQSSASGCRSLRFSSVKTREFKPWCESDCPRTYRVIRCYRSFNSPGNRHHIQHFSLLQRGSRDGHNGPVQNVVQRLNDHTADLRRDALQHISRCGIGEQSHQIFALRTQKFTCSSGDSWSGDAVAKKSYFWTTEQSLLQFCNRLKICDKVTQLGLCLSRTPGRQFKEVTRWDNCHRVVRPNENSNLTPLTRVDRLQQVSHISLQSVCWGSQQGSVVHCGHVTPERPDISESGLLLLKYIQHSHPDFRMSVQLHIRVTLGKARRKRGLSTQELVKCILSELPEFRALACLQQVDLRTSHFVLSGKELQLSLLEQRTDANYSWKSHRRSDNVDICLPRERPKLQVVFEHRLQVHPSALVRRRCPISSIQSSFNVFAQLLHPRGHAIRSPAAKLRQLMSNSLSIPFSLAVLHRELRRRIVSSEQRIQGRSLHDSRDCHLKCVWTRRILRSRLGDMLNNRFLNICIKSTDSLCKLAMAFLQRVFQSCMFGKVPACYFQEAPDFFVFDTSSAIKSKMYFMSTQRDVSGKVPDISDNCATTAICSIKYPQSNHLHPSIKLPKFPKDVVLQIPKALHVLLRTLLCHMNGASLQLLSHYYQLWKPVHRQCCFVFFSCVPQSFPIILLVPQKQQNSPKRTRLLDRYLAVSECFPSLATFKQLQGIYKRYCRCTKHRKLLDHVSLKGNCGTNKRAASLLAYSNFYSTHQFKDLHQSWMIVVRRQKLRASCTYCVNRRIGNDTGSRPCVAIERKRIRAARYLAFGLLKATLQLNELDFLRQVTLHFQPSRRSKLLLRDVCWRRFIILVFHQLIIACKCRKLVMQSASCRFVEKLAELPQHSSHQGLCRVTDWPAVNIRLHSKAQSRLRTHFAHCLFIPSTILAEKIQRWRPAYHTACKYFSQSQRNGANSTCSEVWQHLFETNALSERRFAQARIPHKASLHAYQILSYLHIPLHQTVLLGKSSQQTPLPLPPCQAHSPPDPEYTSRTAHPAPLAFSGRREGNRKPAGISGERISLTSSNPWSRSDKCGAGDAKTLCVENHSSHCRSHRLFSIEEGRKSGDGQPIGCPPLAGLHGSSTTSWRFRTRPSSAVLQQKL
eukprot:284816866_6